ncbi:MAG: hypothetical protein HY902_15710 [Deltaproteobacteria bacterium]|nr:hypothetical protein [Deltaproteobacteria bacterium]
MLVRYLALFAAAVAALAACQKASPPAPDERWPVPPVTALPAPKVPLPQAASPAQAAAKAAEPVAPCEVELAGQLTETAPAGQVLAVYVARGDCLAADAHTLARVVAAEDGKFFTEVFVPCGWQLSLCAAREARDFANPAPKATQHYGKLPRDLAAVGEGEIEFKDLNWPLAQGPDKVFAAPRPVDSAK